MAELVRRWGRECETCKSNYSVMVCYEFINDRNGNSSRREAWRSTLCNCRMAIMYYNGVLKVRDPKDYDKFYKAKKAYETYKEWNGSKNPQIEIKLSKAVMEAVEEAK